MHFDASANEAATGTVVLLRTHSFGAPTRAFFERLAAESGHRAVLLVDESSDADYEGFEKIGFTRQVYEAMDLYCPDDFSWRCGDYALYLARRSFPNATHFWLVEYDVRLSVPHLSRFFEIFSETEDVDLAAALLGRRYSDWYWHSSIADRHRDIYGCLFSLLRISARAIDHLLTRRIAASAEERTTGPGIPKSWPNDEAFVATELVSAKFKCRDLNGFGRDVYNKETFSFDRPIQGETFDQQPFDGLAYHPVLYGAAFIEKLHKISRHRRRNLPSRIMNRCRRLDALFIRAARRLVTGEKEIDFGA
jgi:hypothetical protein